MATLREAVRLRLERARRSLRDAVRVRGLANAALPLRLLG